MVITAPWPGATCAREWIISGDLGTAQDHSALCVVERTVWTAPDEFRDPFTLTIPQEVTLAVRQLQRLPLGLEWDQIVEELCAWHERVRGHALRSVLPGVNVDASMVRVVLDATGLGAVVAELVRKKLPASCRLLAVTAASSTGGKITTGETGIARVSVARRDLVEGLLLAVQQGAISFSRSPAASLLQDELIALRSGRSKAGNVTYESKGTAHDDLIAAVGLGLWSARNWQLAQAGPQGRRLTGI